MVNDLPPLVVKYGDRLEILTIETSEPGAHEVYLAALAAFEVPPERQGVPAVFVGDTHLVGSNEIPKRLGALIERHLRRGGAGWPSIPGLDAFLSRPAEGG